MCPIHNQPWKTVPAGVSKNTGRPYNAFQVCPIQGCKEKPGRVPSTIEKFAKAIAPKPDRNFDKEAYEKCCSIWAAAIMGNKEMDRWNIEDEINSGTFWRVFQAIRADGEKRFATGWAKAEALLKPQPLIPEDEPPFSDNEAQ